MSTNFDFAEPGFPPDEIPVRKSRWPLFLTLVGILFVLSVVIGGCLFVKFGMSVITSDLEMQLRDHPQVQQHLGEISNLRFNFAKSGAIADDTKMVYDVDGSESNAELTIQSVTTDTTEIIRSVSMRVEGGETIELDMSLLAK